MTGQVLLLKRESEIAHDRNAASPTTSNGKIVGHVPYKLLSCSSFFKEILTKAVPKSVVKGLIVKFNIYVTVRAKTGLVRTFQYVEKLTFEKNEFSKKIEILTQYD